MKNVTHVLRFLLFLPLSLGLLIVIYIAVGFVAKFLVDLSLFWLVAILLCGITTIASLAMMFFGFVGHLLSNLNPFKKIGGWIVIPIAIILALYNIFLLWKQFDLSYTRQILIATILTILILYITFIYSLTISRSES